ncbi:NMT1/THI5 like protein [Anaplasma phagocytophilum]|uniref:Immunogenic protein n=3 Tax=Anaplasma phagocytophilum TaxID=948 RepID=A0A168HAW5_ANAPH|nr:TAXI family TRAP transporter solute-binding subunit [Anaplasma phagocytophilum]ANC34261.1 immunogenic protein [Anaplasma phagocytophilum str. Norway variant2]QLL66731.1 TAXI family TRAP transporter solute-binding subunit [Anaplasma phagocytophilum str. Norway variant1]CEH11238.1 Putative immunogenic protein [Anaplasma phagocytophilum]SBO31885.1 NMT1/THI5 like protein [Anaplasma phagocytophilum]SBO32545.1 NMT1/THI5 like protein [Anaplasma phagocytophilum]
MLRGIVTCFVALCSLSFLFFTNVALSADAPSRDFVLIGSGSMTGVYYSIGGGLCKFVVSGYRERHPGDALICSTASTSGSVYNLNAMRRGAMDIGAAQSDIGYYAYAGKNLYSGEQPMQNLRLLAQLHREYLTLIVRADSGIKTIDDIKGKRVNIGAPGTGIRTAMLGLMELKGWTTKDFLVTSDLRASEQVQALCDGKVDVISDFIGHPNASMQEVAATCGSVVLSLDDDLIAQVIEKYPYYQAGMIPGNTYSNIPYDVHTISIRASIYGTTELSDEMAYITVKSIASNLVRFRELSGALRNLTLADLPGASTRGSAFEVPLHEGAEKFYRDFGLITG